jgi:cyclase
VSLRLIARLDIKGENLIKGVHLEGLRKIGEPNEFARKYYEQGADELIYMDTVASLYGRNHLSNLIRQSAEEIFIPMTVGGGIRTIEDVTQILRSGADKVAVNTAAVLDPKLVTNIARRFGSQCMVISIEAQKIGPDNWEVLTNGGREKTGLNVVDWVKQCVGNGAGEVLLTSVDREGTRQGFDVGLVKAVTESIEVPVIASGGMGTPNDVDEVVRLGQADAIAMADILHFNRFQISEVRDASKKFGFEVRNFEV